MKRVTHVKDMEPLKKQRLLARDALERANKLAFKRESSAKWADYAKCEDGCMIARVDHDNIKNCTPEMIQWFFEHLACCTTWNGVDFSGPQVSIYHLWHHRDHVAVTPLTNAGGKQNLWQWVPSCWRFTCWKNGIFRVGSTPCTTSWWILTRPTVTP